MIFDILFLITILFFFCFFES